MSNQKSRDDGPPHEAVAGSPRAYTLVLLLVTIFILYGSLFPFEYRERIYPGGPVVYLLTTWLDWDHRGDLLSNILLYMPFGFFGTLALPSHIPALRRAMLMTVIGTAMSCGIEITQFHDVGRVTSMGDVYANLIGSGIGGLVAVSVGVSVRWPFVGELVTHPTATVLLVMFFGYRLYPYVPMIDLHKYWHAVRPMLVSPSLPPGELIGLSISWLLIAAIIDTLYGRTRFLLLFPLLCGCQFLGKILIINNALTLTDAIGALVAYVLWAMVLHRLRMRFVIVALAFAGMIAAQRLAPLRFFYVPQAFGWIPFGSLMRDAVGPAVQVFCEDLFEYGGLIWLLDRAGVNLPIGTALTAALLLALSIADRWLPGRAAEITDAFMAAVVGGAFMLLRHAAGPGADRMQLNAAAAQDDALRIEGRLPQDGAFADPPRRRGRKHAPYVPPHLRG